MDKKIIFIFATFSAVLLYYVKAELLLVPKRIFTNYYDPAYMKDVNLQIVRYSRTSPYFINVEFDILRPWTNNMTGEYVFFEKFGNTYKRNFIEMRFKMCDLIKEDNLIGFAFKQFGLKCPLMEKRYSFINITYSKKDFKYKMPFDEAKLDISIFTTETKHVVFSGSLYVSIEQRKLRKTSK